MSDNLSKEILDFIISGAGDTAYLSKSERMARKVMVELVRAGRSEFLLLRDEEVAEWWNRLYGGVHEKFEKYKEKVRVYEIKLAAYERLSKEDRKALGIRKPQKPKGL
jgi:hypothetical protein